MRAELLLELPVVYPKRFFEVDLGYVDFLVVIRLALAVVGDLVLLQYRWIIWTKLGSDY